MKIGLIGFGNLGKAFISGLDNSGFHCNNICITAKTQRTMNLVKELYPQVKVFSEKAKLIDYSNIIVLCVEPQNAEEVCLEMQKQHFKDKLIISFMSGVSTSDLIKYLDGAIDKTHVMRAMPNISISNCKGIIGLSHNMLDGEQPELFSEIIKLFERLGQVIQVKEDKLETITVSAACGLAFASTMLKSYQDAIQFLFKDLKLSEEVTLQLFEGVISLIRGQNISFQQLNSIVATKGGSTEAGLNNFDTDSLDKILQTALEASYNRTRNIRINSRDK